jgi:Domain of unknown function (DUF5089)
MKDGPSATEYLKKTDKDSEEKTTKGSGEQEAEKIDLDTAKTLHSANKELGLSLEVSKDSTRALKTQGASLEESLESKERAGKLLDEGEQQRADIERSGNIVNLKPSFLDRVKAFFGKKGQGERARKKRLEEQEAKMQEVEGRIQETEEKTEAARASEKTAQESAGEEPKDAIDQELSTTLSSLHGLRKDVKAQGTEIEKQKYALKQMETIDEDSKKKSKKLTKELEKIE